jgi:hypothetical protein
LNPAYASPSPLKPTVVLLGASNMTRALATVYDITQELCAGPGHYFIAAGHGRSYGLYSRVMGRGLPGILQSGLWDALAQQRGSGRIYALLTDVVNDIAYGQTPEQILEWVTVCLERLLAMDANVVLTALPLASLESLRPARFLLYRTLLFPSNRQSLRATLTTARTLNVALQQLAAQHGIPMVSQPLDWFGADPVHIRRRQFSPAYRAILDHWPTNSSATPTERRIPLPSRLRLMTAAPDWQDVLKWRVRRPQPVATLADGSVISFY